MLSPADKVNDTRRLESTTCFPSTYVLRKFNHCIYVKHQEIEFEKIDLSRLFMDLYVEYRKFPPSVFVAKVYGSCRKSLSDLNKAHASD
jgi:hypothetical protein